MKKILITTDFSENAWNAIFTALKLYAKVDCHFYLLHAFEPSALNLMGSKSQQRLGAIYDSLSKYSKKEIKETLSYLENNHKNPNHQFTSLSKSGNLENAVETVINDNDIDILIMGTQGATGAKEVFLGSNTVKVLKTIKHTPILTVPTGYNFQRLDSIFFATDFTSPYKKSALEPILDLSILWKASIEIIHVAIEFNLNENQESHKYALKERLSEQDYKFTNIPFDFNISKSINQYTEQNNSGILGIIRHQHTFWEKIIGESVVNKIAFHSKIPVIFLPQ